MKALPQGVLSVLLQGLGLFSKRGVLYLKILMSDFSMLAEGFSSSDGATLEPSVRSHLHQAWMASRARHHLNYQCHHDDDKKHGAEYDKEVRYCVHVQHLPDSEEYSVNEVAKD